MYENGVLIKLDEHPDHSDAGSHVLKEMEIAFSRRVQRFIVEDEIPVVTSFPNLDSTFKEPSLEAPPASTVSEISEAEFPVIGDVSASEYAGIDGEAGKCAWTSFQSYSDTFMEWNLENVIKHTDDIPTDQMRLTCVAPAMSTTTGGESTLDNLTQPLFESLEWFNRKLDRIEVSKLQTLPPREEGPTSIADLADYGIWTNWTVHSYVHSDSNEDPGDKSGASSHGGSSMSNRSVASCMSASSRKGRPVHGSGKAKTKMEGWYECEHCGSRFKRKFVRDRHFSSLPVPKVAWMCVPVDGCCPFCEKSPTSCLHFMATCSKKPYRDRGVFFDNDSLI